MLTNILFKNGKPYVMGLKRSTYLEAFESMKKKAVAAGLKIGFWGKGLDFTFQCGEDIYEVCYMEVANAKV